MKGKIDEGGALTIERYEKVAGSAEKFVYQCCPYSQTGHFCGHWCPQFGEPVKPFEGTYKGVNIPCKEKRTLLTICHQKTLVFSSLIDERRKEEKK